MDKIVKNKKNSFKEEDIGFLFWHLGEIENFYPCYKTMIKKE
jgi:hypothetical protein